MEVNTDFGQAEPLDLLQFPGAAQVDIPAVKCRINDVALVYKVTHNRGTMYGWRKMKDQQDSRFFVYIDDGHWLS